MWRKALWILAVTALPLTLACAAAEEPTSQPSETVLSPVDEPTPGFVNPGQESGSTPVALGNGGGAFSRAALSGGADSPTKPPLARENSGADAASLGSGRAATPSPSPTPSATAQTGFVIHTETRQFQAHNDRPNLVRLYEATGGENWFDNENWGSDQPLSEWYGVTVDASGRVTGLDLADNDLVGEIPSALGNLSRLASLDLSQNQLTGDLPVSLADLEKLKEIRVNGNALTGCIPLALSNRLDRSNARYGDLEPCRNPDRQALEDLYHATNGTSWGKKTNWLSDEPLAEWDGVKLNREGRVSVLSLSANGLSGELPASLADLTELEELYLADSPVRSTPQYDQGIIPKPQYVNRFAGGIPPELGTLRKLKVLSLTATGLTGPIPAELGNLASLTELHLSYNQLSGPIPPELGNLTSLRELRLSNNQLSGPIPPEMGNMSSLEVLPLQNNQLSGAIPPELGNLPNITAIALGSNQLTGEIPAELGNIATLTGLDLSENQLTGEIPTEIWNITALKSLNLADNQLSGEIPPESGNLSELTLLYLDRNQLTGEIPRELAMIETLARLSLAGNSLTGNIPSRLADLRHLTLLDLSDNDLTGEVSPDLGQFGPDGRPATPEARNSVLKKVNLTGNRLSGCIPSDVGWRIREFKSDLRGC